MFFFSVLQVFTNHCISTILNDSAVLLTSQYIVLCHHILLGLHEHSIYCEQEDEFSYTVFQPMKGMDTTAEVSLLGEEEEQSPWDNVEDVTYEFVKTGKSKGEGILTTHDGNFKVMIYTFYFMKLTVHKNRKLILIF